jgi:uncharacterized membrane protein
MHGIHLSYTLLHPIFTFGVFSFLCVILYYHGWYIGCGICFGSLYNCFYEKRENIVVIDVGNNTFYLLRVGNFYDAAHWSLQKKMPSFTVILDVTKYPPSLYILMTLGPALIFSLEKPLNKLLKNSLRRVPMFYYLLHIF